MHFSHRYGDYLNRRATVTNFLCRLIFFSFFPSRFAYLKWKIDDKLHAVDRTYANEEHMSPPLGLESKLNEKMHQ